MPVNNNKTKEEMHTQKRQQQIMHEDWVLCSVVVVVIRADLGVVLVLMRGWAIWGQDWLKKSRTKCRQFKASTQKIGKKQRKKSQRKERHKIAHRMCVCGDRGGS